jgi:iron complex outermembrane recepter protein
MQRSRSRKLARLERETNSRPVENRLAKLARHASIGAAVMAAVSAARAQQADTSTVSLPAANAQIQKADADANAPNPPPATSTTSNQSGLEEVIVTASKQATNIQSLPMTVTAITGAQLSNQNIQNFQQFAMEMPQIQIESNGNPGEACVGMRGIPGCGFGFGGQQGSVAIYLDEQPITTPDGEIDWHMYDISRMEVLPGPQGTLYGASSEAGTIRYVTNKPDTSHFSAQYQGQLSDIYNGTVGGIAQGFVNIPFSDNIAGRFVGWYERDSGYLNNVPQTIDFANGATINNAKYVQNHYDPITTEGGRAMFTFKLNDDWSINPTIASQTQRWNGKFGQEDWKDFTASPNPITGPLQIAQFNPEISYDNNIDYTLTVLGKIGNWNLTLASSYDRRHKGDYLEYVDYTLAYQQYESEAQDGYPPTGGHTGCLSTVCWPKNPEMYRIDTFTYHYLSNELRITSPTDYPVHGIVGLYQDRDQGLNQLQEPIPGLDPTYWVGYGTNYVWTNTVYLDDLQTVFRDWAGFAQVNWDISSHLTATAGFRRYRYDNTIQGFYGYSAGYAENVFGASPSTFLVSGQMTCFSSYRLNNGPCTDINDTSEQWGSVPLFTLSYKFDPDHMVYATFSRGYRPGGPNRTQGVPPYLSDYLTNYEVGWKTAWFEHHVIFNGDVFYDDWKDYQFGFTGANGIGVTANAGSAASRGVETQLQWLVMQGLNVTLNVEYTDAHLTANYCGLLSPVTGQPITSGNCTGPGVTTPSSPLAPDGYPLPYATLWKGFLSARYTFPLANATAFVEGDQTYQGPMWTNQQPAYNQAYGNLGCVGSGCQVGSYGLTNFSLGLDKNNWEIELLITNVFNRDAVTNQDAELLRGATYVATYNIIAPPRLIGIQFTQNFQ